MWSLRGCDQFLADTSCAGGRRVSGHLARPMPARCPELPRRASAHRREPDVDREALRAAGCTRQRSLAVCATGAPLVPSHCPLHELPVGALTCPPTPAQPVRRRRTGTRGSELSNNRVQREPLTGLVSHVSRRPGPAVVSGERSPALLPAEAQDSDAQRGGRDDGADHPCRCAWLQDVTIPGPHAGALHRELRVEPAYLGAHLGEARLELVGGDVVAVLGQYDADRSGVTVTPASRRAASGLHRPRRPNTRGTGREAHRPAGSRPRGQSPRSRGSRREGVDDRHRGAVAVVLRVADAGLRQAVVVARWLPCSRRRHQHVGRGRSEPEAREPAPLGASKSTWDLLEGHQSDDAAPAPGAGDRLDNATAGLERRAILRPCRRPGRAGSCTAGPETRHVPGWRATSQKRQAEEARRPCRHVRCAARFTAAVSCPGALVVETESSTEHWHPAETGQQIAGDGHDAQP